VNKKQRLRNKVFWKWIEKNYNKQKCPSYEDIKKYEEEAKNLETNNSRQKV